MSTGIDVPVDFEVVVRRLFFKESAVNSPNV